MNTLREYMFKNGMINNIGDKVTSRQIKKAIRSLPKDMRSIEAAYLQFATPGQYTKWFNKIPLLGTYPIVNKQFRIMKKIKIKPENRGKFNATKKKTGKTTEELTHSKNPVTRKRAIFAQNAAKWNKGKKKKK